MLGYKRIRAAALAAVLACALTPAARAGRQWVFGNSHIEGGGAGPTQPASSITVCMWGLQTSTSGFAFTNGWAGGGQAGVNFFITAGGLLRWEVDTSSGIVDAFSSTVVTNALHRYCGTYDGSNIRVYVDGTQEDVQAQTGNIDYNSVTAVGYDVGNDVGNNNPSSTTISHVAIWDVALTANEISHNETPVYTIRNQSLVLYLPLLSPATNTEGDASGGHANGAIINTIAQVPLCPCGRPVP